MSNSTRVAERQSQRPAVTQPRAMTTTTEHPPAAADHHPEWCVRPDGPHQPSRHRDWCDESKCSSITNGPGLPDTMFHNSTTVKWRTADSLFVATLTAVDDPESNDTAVGAPKLTLSTSSLCPGILNGDVILTITEAAELIAGCKHWSTSRRGMGGGRHE